MEDINVVIVEDEPLIVADLENQLSKSGINTMESFESGEEVLEYLKDNNPDIIIMDIHLFGSLDGIDTAHQINKTKDIPIIFLTSNTDKVTFNRAKLTYPHAFLSKPFRIKDILHSIELALELEEDLDESNAQYSVKNLLDRIFIRDREYMYKVMYKDILYIEADGAYTKIITLQKTFTISQTLKKIEEKLKVNYLRRVHRSFIINIHNVDRLSEGTVHIGDASIPISRAHRESLWNIFNSI